MAYTRVDCICDRRGRFHFSAICFALLR